jgi:hypothetical protein
LAACWPPQFYLLVFVGYGSRMRVVSGYSLLAYLAAGQGCFSAKTRRQKTP